MIVTRIERQKQVPDRYSLFVDGAFAVGVRSAVLLRAGLREGDEVSEQTLERLRADEELGAARAAALKFAGRRRRTEQEVRTRLFSLDFPEPAVDEVVASLLEQGILDDRAYVRAYIHDTQMRRPAGARMIAFRLRGKGIDPSLLGEELGSALGPVEEASLADRLARRYVARTRKHPPSGKPDHPGEREARLRRYLAGRGFGRAAIDAAVGSVIGRKRPGD